MEVSNVNSQSGSNSKQPVRRDILDKNIFLKLLSVQLSNQDPFKAQDNTAYIAQMAQFTSLEQSQNSNASLEKMLLSQRISEGSMMIGKNVRFNLGDEVFVSDIVKSVKVEGGSVYLITENGKFSIDKISQVGDIESDQQNTEQSQA